MKKLSVFFISMSLLFVLSVSSNSSTTDSSSQLEYATTTVGPNGHPIQPPV